MSRREQVKRAIHRTGPDYVPLLFFNRDLHQSDCIVIDIVRNFEGEGKNLSEWGFTWKRKDETMGQPEGALIREWSDLQSFDWPDPYSPQRFAHVAPLQKQYGDRYYIASLVLTGFTIMTFLRGFSQTLEDLILAPDSLAQLADRVFAFETDIIEQCADHGFQAVAFYDDWGDQSRLLISPALWREFFKPRYQKQFDRAHRAGLDVYFHSCGNIIDIVPDLIEIGVDLLNLSQPNLYDMQQVGRQFGGQVCFVCPVSYQTTSISGTREEIFRAVSDLIENLGNYNGGLVGYIEEYQSIGLSEKNYHYCVQAFQSLGRMAYTLSGKKP
ncbi:hypothetical protein JW992_01145 [candidate division KSB1 bacterium]|nr:hypothetical protein [candidate division KSB1 bacterium]